MMEVVGILLSVSEVILIVAALVIGFPIGRTLRQIERDLRRSDEHEDGGE